MNNKTSWYCLSCGSNVKELCFNTNNEVDPFAQMKILECNNSACGKYSAIYEPSLYAFCKNNYNDNKWKKIETNKKVVVFTNDKYKDDLKLCEYIRTAFSNLIPHIVIDIDECEVFTINDIKILE